MAVATRQHQGGGGSKHGDGQGGDGHKGQGGGHVSFDRASLRNREKMRTDTFTLSTSQQPATPIQIPPNGFLRGCWLEVSGTGGSLSASAAVIGSTYDFPFALIATISVEDQNGAPIFGPISGYEAYLTNVYGGYANVGDPATLPGFSGTFVTQYFILWIPLEVRSDGLGALANTDARAQYRLIYTLDSSSNILSTGSISTQPTVVITSWYEYWMQPPVDDLRGQSNKRTPPNEGTTQFWVREVPVIAASAQTVKHNRVGNQIRTIIYVVRNGVAASSTQPSNQRVSNMTDPIQIQLDNRFIVQSESPFLRRRRLMAEAFRLSQADGDPATIGTPTVSQLQTGLYVYWFSSNADYTAAPGDLGNWLDTNEAQLLQLRVTFTGTVATLTILTNDVAVRGGGVQEDFA